MLAQTVREVEAAVRAGRVTPTVRANFQAAMMLLREEKAKTVADAELNERRRTEQLKRLDGIAAILARIAVGDVRLLALLSEEAAGSMGAGGARGSAPDPHHTFARFPAAAQYRARLGGG